MVIHELPSGGLARSKGDVRQPELAVVADSLSRRTETLAGQLAQAITREVRPYQSIGTFDVLVGNCAANVRTILTSIATGTQPDTRAATQVGIHRARDGMPLSSVIEAYRVGFRELWRLISAESATRRCLNEEALPALAAQLISAQGLLTAAMTTAYREEQTRRSAADGAQRAILIDALLHGRILEQCSLWEIADYLQLPSGGPFVVIAAEVPTVGTEALADIESKVRSLDIFSAWRLLPDLQAGIVHVRTDAQLDRVRALLTRMASTRVGVSARFDDLRRTAEALRHARMMLRARREPGVAVFDDSILATAVVTAPEEMVELAAPVLASFADLGDDERRILFETFRTWVDIDGSPTAVAELLCCHPNTVRHRLHRIERRTGRSLSRPRDVAELCLVFQAQHSLMHR